MFSSLNNHSVCKVTTKQGIYQIYLSKSEPTNKTRAEDACFIRNNDISLQVQKIHINTMPKKIHTSTPSHYPVCMHADCPLAQRCLRRNAYITLVKSQEYMHIVNPEKCTQTEGCKYFRDNTPVVYAKGFTNFQKKMTQEQYQKFLDILQKKFGRNPYFERRNGKTLLTQQEQDLIMETLHQLGIKDEYRFDSYLEAFNWNE